MIHTASPRPSEEPEDEKEVIRPAVDGTRSVLKVIAQLKICLRY